MLHIYFQPYLIWINVVMAASVQNAMYFLIKKKKIKEGISKSLNVLELVQKF